MRQAEAACADDEYPVCLAIFADGVNVKKNLEAHPVFCTLMNYDDKPRMTQRCMRLLGIIPGIGTASDYTKDEIRQRGRSRRQWLITTNAIKQYVLSNMFFNCS